MQYVEYRLSEKGSEHQGQWIEFGRVEAKSRRQAMKELSKEDNKDGPQIQRKVRQAE